MDNMQRKSKTILILSIILMFVIIDVTIVFWLLDIRVACVVGNNNKDREYQLEWNSQDNLLQKGNTCGAHSVMAVIIVEKSKHQDPYAIYESIPEKLGRGYIYPWGVTRYLKRNNIQMKSYLLGCLTRRMKEKWIEEKITNNHPVIVIVGTTKYLHYITILGYSEKNYFLYDSEINGDKNKEEPGNITIPKIEVIHHMSNAIFYGLKLNIAISR